jgi:hypothetical protein
VGRKREGRWKNEESRTEQSRNKLNRNPESGDQFNDTPAGARGNQERVE